MLKLELKINFQKTKIKIRSEDNRGADALGALKHSILELILSEKTLKGIKAVFFKI